MSTFPRMRQPTVNPASALAGMVSSVTAMETSFGQVTSTISASPSDFITAAPVLSGLITALQAQLALAQIALSGMEDQITSLLSAPATPVVAATNSDSTDSDSVPAS
jgi:hypothetical protein